MIYRDQKIAEYIVIQTHSCSQLLTRCIARLPRTGKAPLDLCNITIGQLD